MKKPFRLLIFVVMLLLSANTVVLADTYPTLGIPLQLAVPKFSALAATLPTSKGNVGLALQFAYMGNNKFSCTSESFIDGAAASCSGVQIGAKYSLKIKPQSATDKTRISLKGSSVSATTVSATYKGLKGKLSQRKVSVSPRFATAAVDSTIVLRPTIASNGGLKGSTGDLSSGYSLYNPLLTNIPLKGKVKTVKNNKFVNWSLKGAGNSLNFSGKELNGSWVGKLRGNIGPAKISKMPVTIPLVEYNPNARFYGTVLMGDGSSNPKPDKNVLAILRSDRNNNGSIESDETVTVEIDNSDIQNSDKGQFDQNFAVTTGRPVTVEFISEGYSQNPQLFASVSPGAEVLITTTLRKLDTLNIVTGNASSADGKLQLKNLPSNIVSLTGKGFNPAVEASQFPGEFFDNTGNILISSVFAAMEAKDVDGHSVTELSGTRLNMLVPRDTWNTLRDLSTGNNQIDVPLYYYDAASNKWKRSTDDAWLENEAGVKLSEASLADLKAKSYVGNIYAAGTIDHLSYWSIDWPIPTHSCISGSLVDSDGKPISGAVITANGTTYTGNIAPVTTSYTGRFCVDVMRSEAPGEDLNNNGTNGEESKVILTAFVNGKYYDLGSQVVPSIPPTCSTSGCTEACKDLGAITLESSIEIPNAICPIKGKVVYSGAAHKGNANINPGDPITDLIITGYDSSSPNELLTCNINNPGCLFTITNSLGEFELNVTVMLGAELWATSKDLNTNFYLGTITTQGCPAESLTIGADFYGVLD